MFDRPTRLFLRWRDRGDAAALAELFDRTAPELLRLALHLCRHAVDAEDVLQATFLGGDRECAALRSQASRSAVADRDPDASGPGLARWAQAIYLGPLLGEQRKELLDGPSAPLGRDARYGCGSILQPTRLGLAVGHSGFFPSGLDEMRAFPDHGVAVAILVNSSADLRVVREMTRWVVELADAALAK